MRPGEGFLSRLPHGGVARWRLGRRPSETDALIAAAHRHIADGRSDPARRLVKEALLTEMSLVEGLEVGRLLDALDETQAAVDLFGTLLRAAGDAIDAATVRAWLLMVLGRYDEASEPLRFLVEHRPEDAEARLQLAQCLSRSGRHPEAVEAARRVRFFAPPWPDLHVELGRLLLRLGEIETANAVLRGAVELEAANGRVALAVAAVWQRAGRASEALPIYEAALGQAPDELELLIEAGQAFASAGRLDAARRCLDQLGRHHPGRTDARRRLASAIAEAGGGVAGEGGEGEGTDAGESAAPVGFAAVVPAPGDGQALGDVTTGEVEAALGTLDLDFDLDDSLGSVPELEPIDTISRPLAAGERPRTGERPPRTGERGRPGRTGERGAPRPTGGFTVPAPLGADEGEPSHPARSGPVVPARAGKRRYEGEPRLLADIAAESTESERADGEEVSADGSTAARADDRGEGAQYGTLRAEPAHHAAHPAPPRADVAHDGTPRADAAVLRADEGATPRADDRAAPRAATEARRPASAEPPPRSELPTPPGAEPAAPPTNSVLPINRPRSRAEGRAAQSAFALVGPPSSGRRRPTGPLVVDTAALPPLMTFGSLSNDASVELAPLPAPPPGGGRSRRGDGRERAPGAGSNRASNPASGERPGAGPIHSSGEHRLGAIHSSGEHRLGAIHSSGEHRLGAIHTSGEHRLRPGPSHSSGEHRVRPVTEPLHAGEPRAPERNPGPEPSRGDATGPLPRLPQRRRFAEMAVGRGLTSPGMPLPDGGRHSASDDVSGRPPPMSPPGWDAAPRQNPLLTTSDALQRWRPAGGNPLQVRVDGPRADGPRADGPRPDAHRPDARPDARPDVPRPARTAVVAGDPAVFWIPRLLRFMAAGRLTGTVRLVTRTGSGEVLFSLGRLTGATATGRPSLATVLARPDRLGPDQRQRLGAIAGNEDGEALLDRLVDAGLFEAPNVQAAVIDQVFATVGDLVTWHDGWFTVETRSDPGGARSGARLPLGALLGGVEDDREEALARLGPRVEAPREARVEARIRTARQRLDAAPEDALARLALGELLSRAGDHVEAIEVLTASLGRSSDPRLVEALGRVIDALATAGPRRGSERLVLCGRLGRVNLVQLVELLGDEGVTGTLRLIAGEGLGEIHVVDGRLAGASNTNTARLGDLLRASSAVSSEQIEALVADQRARRGHRPIGQLVLERGWVDGELLAGLLHKQVRLALLESGRWRHAHFIFALDDRRRGARPEHDLDTDGIWRDLSRMIGHPR